MSIVRSLSKFSDATGYFIASKKSYRESSLILVAFICISPISP